MNGRAWMTAIGVGLAVLHMGCPRPPMPKGPPPEYEEVEEPAWFKEAGAPSSAPDAPPPVLGPAPVPPEALVPAPADPDGGPADGSDASAP